MQVTGGDAAKGLDNLLRWFRLILAAFILQQELENQTTSKSKRNPVKQWTNALHQTAVSYWIWIGVGLDWLEFEVKQGQCLPSGPISLNLGVSTVLVCNIPL